MITLLNGAAKALTSTRMMLLSPEYKKENYLINASVPRFGSGEAKGILGESVRGKDIYLMVDVCNYNVTYSLTGNTNHMSPGYLSRT